MTLFPEDYRGQGERSRKLSLFFHISLAGSLYLVYLVLSPLLDAIIFAAVLAFLLTPLYDRLLIRTKSRKNLAAFIVLAGGAVVIVIPLLLLIATLMEDGVEATSRIQGWLEEDGLTALFKNPVVVGRLEWIRENVPLSAEFDVGKQLLALSRKVGEIVLSQGTALATGAAVLVMRLFLLFFVLFYFIRDGRKLLENLKEFTPMTPEHEEAILSRMAAMSKAVLVGTFLTALAQGVAGGIGFAIVGINPFFWGAVLSIASLVPMVGTALIWLPATIYLLVAGQVWSAVFLAAWCTLLVGSIDNFLRPFLMQGDNGLSPLFIFLGVVGGLSVFGMPGILYGPLALTLATVLLDLYRTDSLEEAKADS